MAKTQIQKVTPPNSLIGAKPSWLKNKDLIAKENLDALRDFIVLPRIKVIQKSADATLLKTFGIGDVILSPMGMLLAEMTRSNNRSPDEQGPPLFFTPLFFFPEWVTWNPIEMKGSLPAIVYRTTDPQDQVAAKAKDPSLRREILKDNTGKPIIQQGRELFVRHVEHLNWICILHDHPVKDAFILTFSRGEHFAGRNFASLIRMRKADPFACVFKMQSTYRPSRGQGDWYGLNVTNPVEDDGRDPWVSSEQYETLAEAFSEWKTTHGTRGVRPDLSDVADEPEYDEDTSRQM